LIGLDHLVERQTIEFLLERWRSIKDEDEEKAVLQEALRDKISKLENFAQLASAIATELRDQLDCESNPANQGPGRTPEIPKYRNNPPTAKADQGHVARDLGNFFQVM
jgi:hypothetical protein